MRLLLVLCAIFTPFSVTPLQARELLVRDLAEFRAAASTAGPGDSIVLANGQWRDADLRLDAVGTSRKPVILKGQSRGGVIIAGRSTLRIAGRHIVVRDLVFRDGAPLEEAAIVTRIGDKWTENLRITNIVIDRFSNPNRRVEDHWVALYGRDIRVDHSHFEGKQNAGATFVVIREKPWPLDNRVRIDRNYFGPRPPLGSNTGETLRIGTSDESLNDASSIVEDNIFERCDGEVEIVSIKSGGNIVRRNLFLNSQGAVVLRHGNGNLVEDNIFMGGGLPNTGGVRVINRNQTVRGNYMEGLTGRVFTGALTLMNGVPNSAINRYHQVDGAVISNNSIVDPAAVIFGAGASAERSSAPQDVRLSSNLLWASDAAASPFRVDASMDGVRFEDNVANVAAPSSVGFRRQDFSMRRASNGLLYPTSSTLRAAGVKRSLRVLARSEVGANWYRPSDKLTVASLPPKAMQVGNVAQLVEAVANATDGAVIDLGSATLELSAPLPVRRSITLTGKGVRISFTGATLFEIQEGGSLKLRGLEISGASAPVQPGNAVIRTQARSMLTNYVIDIEDCRFSDLAIAPGFDLIATSAGTFAGKIRLANSRVADVSGTVLAAASERGKSGLYPVEETIIDRVQFVRAGTVVDLLRAGTDESTFGPRLAMTGSTITDSGIVQLSGAQVTHISGNRFERSGGIAVTHSVGEPLTEISRNIFSATPPPRVTELHYSGAERAIVRENNIQ